MRVRDGKNHRPLHRWRSPRRRVFGEAAPAPDAAARNLVSGIVGPRYIRRHPGVTYDVIPALRTTSSLRYARRHPRVTHAVTPALCMPSSPRSSRGSHAAGCWNRSPRQARGCRGASPSGRDQVASSLVCQNESATAAARRMNCSCTQSRNSCSPRCRMCSIV